MISAFTLLFALGLLSLAFHRTAWLKPLMVGGLLLSMSLTLSGYTVGLVGFSSSEAIKLFEFILEIVLMALVLHDDEDITITQTLFLGAASILLLQSDTILSFVIAFEAVSIISIVLVSHIKTPDQAEGALKMFIAGSIATGILLLGVAFYVMGGGLLLEAVPSTTSLFSTVGLFIMLAALFYKLTIVPMHGWAADSYALVRHSHAAILSGVAKTVVAVAAFKMLEPFLVAQLSMSVPLLVVLAVITMTLGNFMALFQKRIAKILAYSSIAQAGYMLLAFAAVQSSYASTGLLYMAIAYIFMQSAVFLLLDTLRKQYDIITLDDIRGLSKSNKLLSFLFSVQLLSLAGIPLLAGFLGKVVVFYAGVDAGLWYVVLIALLNSALSVGYYAWIIKHMYFDEEQSVKEVYHGKLVFVAQFILLAGTLYFGLFASTVFDIGVGL